MDVHSSYVRLESLTHEYTNSSEPASHQASQILHRLANFKDRVRRVLAFNRKVASVFVFFENRHQFYKVNGATAKLCFDPAPLREVSDAILGVNV